MQEQFAEEQQQEKGKGAGKGDGDATPHEEGELPNEDGSTN
jgi:hypothetical protein